MSTLQVVQRAANVLRGRTWQGSGDPVFPPLGVRVSLADPIVIANEWGLSPACAVAAGPSQADETNARLQQVDVVVTILAAVVGDRVAEGALIGANRTSATASAGRGLYELEVEVHAAIAELHGEGINIAFAGATGDLAVRTGDDGYAISKVLGFTAWTPAANTYMAPASVSLSETGGTVTIDWDAPDVTTDIVDYVVRVQSGVAPVVRSDEGTDVGTVTAPTTQTTHAPGSGTWTYSVFARYADAGGSIANNISDFVYATVTVS